MSFSKMYSESVFYFKTSPRTDKKGTNKENKLIVKYDLNFIIIH